jgi:hypothetical protein
MKQMMIEEEKRKKAEEILNYLEESLKEESKAKGAQPAAHETEEKPESNPPEGTPAPFSVLFFFAVLMQFFFSPTQFKN